MRIDGAYNLYTSFNSTEALNRIKRVDPETLQSIDNKSNQEKASNEQSKGADGSSIDAKLVEAVAVRKDADVAEIAKSLQSRTGFEPVGRNSDIRSLDVMQAVSDLQKDATLQQYQYFVGDASIMENTEDGIVIQKSGADLF